MADLDPTSVPAVMPVNVPRTTPQGYPTKFMLDWEQATQSWFVNTAVDLQTKITTVEQTAEDAAAAVVTEATARASADSALATSITTVSASVGNISANGAVYLASKAAPSGATAAYGWYLSAGSAFAGMEAIALSSGGSAIGFTADKFRFVDSGSAVTVLSYSSGKFQFTGDVAISGSLIVTGSVATAAVAANAVTTLAASNSSGLTTSTTLTTRASASGVLIAAAYIGSDTSTAGLDGTLTLKRDGATLQSISVAALIKSYDGVNPTVFRYAQTNILYADYPSAGSHTYEVTLSASGATGGVTIAVLEAAR